MKGGVSLVKNTVVVLCSLQISPTLLANKANVCDLSNGKFILFVGL